LIEPATMIDALEGMSGLHHGYRRAHALGGNFEAVFHPSGEAAAFTTAAHLQHDPVPAIVRFSNTNGDPATSDLGVGPTVRGMSVKFRTPETDLVSMNLPVFMASTPENFLELTRALTGKASGSPERADAVIAFITAHPESAASFGLAAVIPDPVSYGTARYWANHAFTWLAPDGTRSSVRYRWEPDAGLQTASPERAPGWPAGYLIDELAERLRRGPVAFSLVVQFAAPGDPTADPTQAWPDDRTEITAGRLEIARPAADELKWDNVVFDPTRLVSGIELSDDPVLAYRASAYTESFRRRSHERSAGENGSAQ
jgi:catalase